MIAKLVSGGQTGVDRAALDAAIELGVPCGGWCPKGRKAEDGVVPARYPLAETPSACYAQRTRWNIRDSDATLILTWGKPTGGTLLTLNECCKMGRPHLVIDLVGARDTRAAPDWRPLEEALALYRAPPVARAEMEARILAREDTPAVARKCGLAEEVVDTYHDLFFDLRPKLDCSSYVVCQILGDPSRVIEESDRARLLKLLAYFGGPHVLDELLWYYRTPPKDVPLRLKHLSLAELKEMRRWVNVRLFIRIFTYQPETDAEKIRYPLLCLHHSHRGAVSQW